VTSANWIARNQTMWSQRPALPNNVSPILLQDIMQRKQSGNSVPTFQDNLLIPASRAKKFKTENRAWQKLT